MHPEPRFMERAVELALEGVRSGSGGPFGAVVVFEGEVVGEGFNRVLADRDPTAHAEVLAIRAAAARFESFDLTGCELYASSEPCPMCLAACHWARLERVWFSGDRERAAAAGFDDALFYRELELPPAERKLPLRPFLPDASEPAFRAWLAKQDRTPY